MLKKLHCDACGKDSVSQVAGRCLDEACPSNAHRVGPKSIRRCDELVNMLRAAHRVFEQSWMAQGAALLELREDKHYRDLGFTSFDGLCKAEGYTRSGAYGLISAYQAGEKVSKILDTLPARASQTKALAEVIDSDGAETAVGVYEAAGPKPTEAKIRAAGRKRKAVPERNQPALEPTYAIEQPCAHPSATCDDCGARVRA